MEIIYLDSLVPAEFTFDFSDSPIPAGITDLYLHVVFKGSLGDEKNDAIAVGMKDISEPMHIALWNVTDRFYLDGVLRTAEEIRADPLLFGRVDHNKDGVSDEHIDPYPVTTRIGFAPSPSGSPLYTVTYDAMPPGGYGKTIVLTDLTPFYLHVNRESVNPPDILDSSFIVSAVINQDGDSFFHETPVSSFRGVTQHQWTAFGRYYPDWTGITDITWPLPETNPCPQGPCPAIISQ